MSTASVDLGPIASSGGSGSNASVGTIGQAGPAMATQIAGTDPSGNLVAATFNEEGQLEIAGSLVNVLGFSILSPGYPTQVSIGTSSSVLLPANPDRVYAHFVNNSQNMIFIQYSSLAALNQGIKISSGSLFTLSGADLYLGVVNAISVEPNQLIDVLEGE